jgi:hypothetical protein
MYFFTTKALASFGLFLTACLLASVNAQGSQNPFAQPAAAAPAPAAGGGSQNPFAPKPAPAPAPGMFREVFHSVSD